MISVIFLCSAILYEQLAHDMMCKRVNSNDPIISFARFNNYVQNAQHSKFVLNTNFWLKDVDFSCASPWNDASGRLRAGTAISKRHIIFAKHFPIPKGTRILFSDGKLDPCPCRLIDSRSIPDTDISVGLLDYELTPNIKPAKILPANFSEYMPVGSKWPVVTFDQNEKAFLSEAYCMIYERTGKAILRNGVSGDDEWKKFSGKLTTGDSGNPAFLIIGNQAVFLYTLSVGGVGLGPMLHTKLFDLQKAMDDMCPGYRIEFFNFETCKGNDCN